jgi:hypothetical protein
MKKLNLVILNHISLNIIHGNINVKDNIPKNEVPDIPSGYEEFIVTEGPFMVDEGVFLVLK